MSQDALVNVISKLIKTVDRLSEAIEDSNYIEIAGLSAKRDEEIKEKTRCTI